MKYRILMAAALLLTACGSPADVTPPGGPGAQDVSAEQIARDVLIIDTHVDVPYRLRESPDDISERTEGGHFDFPRAVEGGLNAPFMSIYVPSKYEDNGARAVADELIDLVEQFQNDWPDKFAVATSPDQLLEHKDKGLISLPMGMENASPMEGDLKNLHHFFDRGIRYITLTHDRCNHIGDSSYDKERIWHGLSPFGEELVQEMNRIGMMVDITHVSDETFYAVMEISKAPVIASHSSCREFTPDFERNMNDDMILKLAGGGGVIMINFGSAFLDGAAQKQTWGYWDAWKEYSEANGGEMKHGGMDGFKEQYWTEHEKITGDVGTIADHIDHVVALVGIDHVGIGSDFDGIGTLPKGMENVTGYPNLVRELLSRDYSREEIEKVLSGNILRVWRQVEQISGEIRTGEQS
ncbi:MAG: dipeptidase [Acidobacteria bacterium]|uniref:Dipeptidase n=1 Tax=Candidatus Polarisedimenticola svalbardensis TaxID=2886004 RepID=A0A8J7C297_9BACT|nr:dipeptidase [Candidatus Polarisedimenticola svalbardensis]